MTTEIKTTELDSFQFLRKIIMEELEIESERVMIFNQKWIIPKYDYMFVVLECRPAKTLSSRNYTEPDGSGVREVQELTLLEHIIISVFSRNDEALRRKEEIVAALGSIYSQELQMRYGYKILNRNPPIEDLTMLEGAANLYRYDIPVFMKTWFQKKKTVDFFDQFRVEVNMNDGLPDIDEKFSQPT